MSGDREQGSPGRQIAGRYRLDSVIGRGGMGTVWRALDEMLDRQVAVKEVTVREDLSEGERTKVRARTLREARATARLSHPGIVTVHDVVDEDDRPWIVMELVTARSLAEILEDGPLPPAQVADIGRQMVEALRAAHAVGILHRDVKPANVLITPEGRAVLTDFGIARFVGDTTLTQTGLLVGSPAYLPPERAKGDPAMPASDLWSLGATLYTAVEGRPPYDRPDMMAVLAAVMTEEPPPPQNAGPLTPVLGGLLLRDPVQRLTAERAEEMLAQVASGTQPAYVAPVTASAPSYPTHTLQPPPPAHRSTNPGILVLVGALATIAIVLTVVVVMQLGSEGDGGPDDNNVANSTETAAGRHNGQITPSSPPRSSSPATPVGSSPSAPTVPAGFKPASGSGYQIAVPQDWTRSSQRNSDFWRAPDSEAYVQVDRTPWSGDPYAHWEQWENEVVAGGQMRDYTRVLLSRRVGLSYDAADLEFTWTNPRGVRMHGIDRGAVAGGRVFAVFIAIPQDQWDGNRERVNNILDTFRP